MRKNTKKKVVKVEVMDLKLQKDSLYLGETDPAQFIWSNKTHRSASEAFRDADYAIAIQRHRSEWDDCKEFLGGLVWIAPAIGFLVYICYLILKEI